MDKKYIDQFFETGKIRLSSFDCYQKYEDNVRGDKGEGWNIAVGQNEKETVFAVIGVGSNAYSFCTSTVYSKELMEKFNCDSAFRIKDSSAFGMTIAKKVSGLVEAFQGNCVYTETRSTIKQMSSFFDDLKLHQTDQSFDLNKLGNKIKELNSIDSYFMKPMKYQYQGEYRFIWLIQGETNEYLEIECKEALEFCERISTL